MTDANMSDTRERITAPAEFLEQAINELLRRIPETRQAYRPDDLTETQTQALYLLTAAGMVERCERLRLRMVNHPVVAEATITFTGEYGGVEAVEPLAAQLLADWQEPYRKWKESDTRNIPPFHCERLEPSEWRLTDQGVIASKNAAKDSQNEVFDFVLKRGFFDGQPRLMPDGRISQRKPIRGKGALVRMDTVKGQVAAPSTVNIGNWGEGAEAFANAWAKLPEVRAGRTSGDAAPIGTTAQGKQPEGKADGADKANQQSVAELEDNGTKLSPSRVKAQAVYEYALNVIAGAEKMTIADLFTAVQDRLDLEIVKASGNEAEKLQELKQSLPASAETFAKYLRDAGIKRYNSRGERVPGRSIRRRSEI